MRRVATPAVEVESAKRATAELFAQIKETAGKVPNTFAGIGGHAPAALRAMLLAGAVLATGSLGKQDQEIIKLTISVAVGCDYCAVAHAALGQLAGLTPDVIKRVRVGQATGDARRDALLHFVRLVVLTPGEVSDEALSAVKAAGYTDAQMVDISLALNVIACTNILNRINDTTLDVSAAA